MNEMVQIFVTQSH